MNTDSHGPDRGRPAAPAAHIATPALPGLAALLTPTAELYLDLHRHPELSGAERRTAGRFADWLAADGFRVLRGVGGHGVAAELRNGDGPAVLLRAELDALPVAEDTGVPYASTVTAPGPDGGTVPVMHACGHDAHLACAAAAARWLASRRDHWRGTLLVVGQPAEETLSGARAMLEDGLYERITPPDEVLAQHTAPFPAGMVAHADGPVLAGSVTLEVVFQGEGGHAATPHLAADPLLAAAGVVTRLASVAAREADPAERLVVTASSLHTGNAGHAGNVIASRAELRLTARAFTEAALDRAVSAVERVVSAESSAAALPPRATVTPVIRSGVTLPDPEVAVAVRDAHRARFGAGRVTGWPGSTATEDFPLLTGAGARLHGRPGIRGAYWMLGSTGPAQWSAAPGTGAAQKIRALPANHSPRYLPSVRLTLETGTAALVTAALARLGRGPGSREVRPATAWDDPASETDQ
ncbi:amidohydrolase [Streptomyces sp. NPDC059766]|uniref:amidohydrolase n=1 Tax=Streptomyces sp. NPDC059766 TaxID=3346940 RepID=UPI0036501C4B